MNKRTLAILAAIGATAIYGVNHTIAKGVMPNYVGAYAFVVLRVIGAATLFWIISLFGPKEKIAKKDYLRMVVCAIFGMGLNMLVFFKGLSLSTPINSAVLITTTPIIVLILSALWIKEKISGKKVFGIFVGLLGAMGLILFGSELREFFNSNEFLFLWHISDIGQNIDLQIPPVHLYEMAVLIGNPYLSAFRLHRINRDRMVPFTVRYCLANCFCNYRDHILHVPLQHIRTHTIKSINAKCLCLCATVNRYSLCHCRR